MFTSQRISASVNLTFVKEIMYTYNGLQMHIHRYNTKIQTKSRDKFHRKD